MKGLFFRACIAKSTHILKVNQKRRQKSVSPFFAPKREVTVDSFQLFSCCKMALLLLPGWCVEEAVPTTQPPLSQAR